MKYYVLIQRRLADNEWIREPMFCDGMDDLDKACWYLNTMTEDENYRGRIYEAKTDWNRD